MEGFWKGEATGGGYRALGACERDWGDYEINRVQMKTETETMAPLHPLYTSSSDCHKEQGARR